MAQAQSVDINTTIHKITAIAKNSDKVLDNFDMNISQNIQYYLNNLYSGKYGKVWAYSFFGIPLANLTAGIIVFALFFFLRHLFARWIVKPLLMIAKRTKTNIDDIILQEISKPIEFFIILLGFHLFVQIILIQNGWIDITLKILATFNLYWFIYAFTPAIQEFLNNLGDTNKRLSQEFNRFLIRIIRLIIVVAGFLTILNILGVNITAFLASLGLGGLAFALAAKDTAANFFGSIAILLDQSIKIGEWVKIEDVEGIVEDIGMRTTKIRTFQKSITIVPNSKIANTNIENYSRRGIRRIKMSIGLTYDTTPEQILAIVEDIEQMLLSHHSIANDQTMLINFTDFNASDLGIFIYAFANTSVWKEYLQAKQSINIEIMKIVKKHGANFAFPSQSLYIEKTNLLPQKSEQE